MNAEEYIKSQLDGTFVKWLGLASYETQGAGYPFKEITVPKDFVPPMCRPKSEEASRVAVPPRVRKSPRASAPRGHRAARVFDERERILIRNWMNEGVSQMEIVARLRCGRDTFGRYLKEIRGA